jgi:hypothetical protein
MYGLNDGIIGTELRKGERGRHHVAAIRVN